MITTNVITHPFHVIILLLGLVSIGWAAYPGYQINSIRETDTGFIGDLSLLGYLFYFILSFYTFFLIYNFCSFFVLFLFNFYSIFIQFFNVNFCRPGPYGNDIAVPGFQVTYVTKDILRITILDSKNPRYLFLDLL